MLLRLPKHERSRPLPLIILLNIHQENGDGTKVFNMHQGNDDCMEKLGLLHTRNKIENFS